jgi:hypothetical protein
MIELGVGEDTQLCDLVHIFLGRFLDTEAHFAVGFKSNERISQRKAALWFQRTLRLYLNI